MTYAGVGVDYDAMDPFKRLAQIAGRETAINLRRLGCEEVEWSRGESCYLIDIGELYLGHVEEGLGTKDIVAGLFRQLLAIAQSINPSLTKSYYGQIAQCTVAMIVNDMITLGVRPLSVAMHLAVGDSNWFDDEQRCRDLVEGWKKACMLARCAWGGGETSTLKGIVVPETAVLSGSAVGMVKPKERLIMPNRIQDGDAILILESSGIHANGLTMAREIANKLPDSYLTKLKDGRTYGETLLDPTIIYVSFVEDGQDNGIDFHYLVNVTGHGWRKVMRATQPFTYIIERLPRQSPIFEFLQEHGPIDDREAFGNLNMGAGFMAFMPESDLDKALETAGHLGFNAIHAGHIESSKTKKVVIQPKDLEFTGSSLGVR